MNIGSAWMIQMTECKSLKYFQHFRDDSFPWSSKTRKAKLFLSPWYIHNRAVFVTKPTTCIRYFRSTSVVLRYSKEPQANTTSFLFVWYLSMKSRQWWKKNCCKEIHCAYWGWFKGSKMLKLALWLNSRLTTATNTKATFQYQRPVSWSPD